MAAFSWKEIQIFFMTYTCTWDYLWNWNVSNESYEWQAGSRSTIPLDCLELSTLDPLLSQTPPQTPTIDDIISYSLYVASMHHYHSCISTPKCTNSFHVRKYIHPCMYIKYSYRLKIYTIWFSFMVQNGQTHGIKSLHIFLKFNYIAFVKEFEKSWHKEN